MSSNYSELRDSASLTSCRHTFLEFLRFATVAGQIKPHYPNYLSLVRFPSPTHALPPALLSSHLVSSLCSDKPPSIFPHYIFIYFKPAFTLQLTLHGSGKQVRSLTAWLTELGGKEAPVQSRPHYAHTHTHIYTADYTHVHIHAYTLLFKRLWLYFECFWKKPLHQDWMVKITVKLWFSILFCFNIFYLFL